MINVLVYSVMVAMTAAFLLLLAYKWGVVEYLQVHGNDFISKMAHCDFCMSWWLCVFLTVLVIRYTCDCHMLLIPFIATPIARRIL